jgi:hypothetical protein
MWIFHQATGRIEHNGTVVSQGYSGARTAGINLSQAVGFFGPIPRGPYAIGLSFSNKSPTCVLSLTPMGHAALGRSGFLIHGDNIDPSKAGTASDGCIILPLNIRTAIWNSGDRTLFVQL